MQKDECKVADAGHSRQVASMSASEGMEAVDEAGTEFERYRIARGTLCKEVKFGYKNIPLKENF